MSGPHILVLNVFFAPQTYGGATVVAEEVAHALRRRHGCRITALSLVSRAELAPYALIKAEVRGIESYLVNIPLERPWAESYNNPALAQRVGEICDTLGPDLVHVHCVQDMGAGVIEAARARDLPVILSVHDFWWICERQFMIRVDDRYCGQSRVTPEGCRTCVASVSAARTRRAYLLGQAALADRVTYPSRFALELCEASGLAPGRGAVWENGVRLPGRDFFAAQAARRAAAPDLAFGYLGGPAHIKGWPLMRRAFAGLGRRDFSVHLVDGDLSGGWWKGQDFSDLPGRWHVHPRFAQDRMDEFYARIDVLFFLSQWKETFGLAIREALARGIRVIQTDSGGTVEHGAACPGDLIPIGSGPEPVRHRIAAELEQGQVVTEPRAVAGFDDQARAFMDLARPLLAQRGAAA